MMSHYDASGHPVSSVNYRADNENRTYDVGEVLDRGNVPDFEKDSLDGQTVLVVGIKGPEDFPLGPVYFVLLKLEGTPQEVEPYGVMFAATSPLVATVMAMAERKRLPFRAELAKVASNANRGYEYWVIRRPVNALQTALPNTAANQAGNARAARNATPSTETVTP